MKTHRLKILQVEENWKNRKNLVFNLTSSLGQFFEMPIEELGSYSFDLNSSEVISIRVYNSLTKELVSHVEFPLISLKRQTDWIPLLPAGQPSLSKSFADPVPVPRLLIEFFPIKSITENQDLSQDFLESFASELAFVSMMENSSLDSQDLVQSSELTVKYKRQCSLTKILSKQLEYFKLRLQDSNSKVSELEKQLSIEKVLKEKLKDESIMTEKHLIDLVQEKEVQLSELICQISFLENKLRVVDNEKEHLMNKVIRLELEIEKDKYLEKDLENAKSLIRKGEEIQDQLNKKIIKITREFKDEGDEDFVKRQVLVKDQEIAMLKMLTDEIKRSADMQILSYQMENEELKQLLVNCQEQERCLAGKLRSYDSGSSSDSSVFEIIFAEFIKKNQHIQIKKINFFTVQIEDQIYDLAYSKEGIHLKFGLTLRNLDYIIPSLSKKSTLKETNEKFSIKKTHEKSPLKETQEKSQEEEVKPMKKVLSHSFLKDTKSSINKSRTNLSKSPISTDTLRRKPFLI